MQVSARPMLVLTCYIIYPSEKIVKINTQKLLIKVFMKNIANIFNTLLGTYWTQQSNMFVGVCISNRRPLTFFAKNCEVYAQNCIIRILIYISYFPFPRNVYINKSYLVIRNRAFYCRADSTISFLLAFSLNDIIMNIRILN